MDGEPAADSIAARRDRYLAAKRDDFESEAALWSPTHRDRLVGSYDAHNAWPDYDIYLFRYLDTRNMIALDFGCGPGRNLVKYHPLFRRIDGVDISPGACAKAVTWVRQHYPDATPRLYVTNGWNLADVPSGAYDLVFSTIALQHIGVRAIRLSLFCEFHRVLRLGGTLSFQMGFGNANQQSVAYEADAYETPFCDTRVEDVDALTRDLNACGFILVRPVVRRAGPGDRHAQWVFVTADRAATPPTWTAPWNTPA